MFEALSRNDYFSRYCGVTCCYFIMNKFFDFCFFWVNVFLNDKIIIFGKNFYGKEFNDLVLEIFFDSVCGVSTFV